MSEEGTDAESQEQKAANNRSSWVLFILLRKRQNMRQYYISRVRVRVCVCACARTLGGSYRKFHL